MPVFVGCPKCGLKLSVPESLLGRQVRCASCLTQYEAKEEVAPPRRPEPPPDRSWDEPPPGSRYPEPPPSRRPWDDAPFPPRRPSRYDDDYDDYGRPPLRRDQVPHRSSLILTLGIVSIIAGSLGFCCYGLPAAIALPTGLCAWLMGQGDLRQMDQGLMDSDGRSNTHGGVVCGIIGTVLGGLDVVCGIVAFFTGIMGNTL
jgi:hypothetical protein